MKANQLATLVLRLIGIYYLVEAVSVVSLTIGEVFEVIKDLHSMKGFDPVNELPVAIEAAIALITTVTIGILLIVYSVPWGEKLVPQSAGDDQNSTISFNQAQTLAFAVAGVLIIAGTLPQLFTSLSNLLHALSRDYWQSDPAHNNPRIIETTLGIFLKLALGLWLFFGTEGFANFWRSLRNFGTPKPPQT